MSTFILSIDRHQLHNKTGDVYASLTHDCTKNSAIHHQHGAANCTPYGINNVADCDDCSNKHDASGYNNHKVSDSLKLSINASNHQKSHHYSNALVQNSDFIAYDYSARLSHIIHTHQLPLICTKIDESFSNKLIKAHKNRIFLHIDQKGRLCVATFSDVLIKICNDWTAYTPRIVAAGRKTEALLAAAKINQNAHIIDATAGFGLDMLILAHAGAKICAFENNPIMALLLLYEKARILDKNWQSLLKKIDIVYGVLDASYSSMVDLVYLDPMFEKDAFFAKVNKNMQFLHTLCKPPTDLDAANLLNISKAHGKKVLVKRAPKAPFLAHAMPHYSHQFASIRFDEYRGDA